MKRLTPAIPILVIVILAAAAALPCPAAGIRLDFAPAATVAGPQVTLGDVAIVRGGDAGTAAELQRIVIGCAPMPGKSRPLDTQYIKVRLRQHGFDPDTIQAAWPDRVLITRRCMVIGGAELMAAGEEALRAQAAPTATSLGDETAKARTASSETVITCSRPPADLVLPEGALELKAELLGGLAHTSRLVKVTAWVDGRPQASQTICYRVRAFADVVTASRQIERGAAIAADDLAVTRCELSGGDAVFLDAAEVIGMRARRALRAGEVIARCAVTPMPAVERGQKVWVTVNCGVIRLRAEAVACADAPAGGTVRMKNEASGETFVARVDAAGHVFVTP